MKPYSAFLVIIKTNFGKIIGQFVESKLESTRGMKCEINGDVLIDCKLINNVIIYYFLDDQLVKCPWKQKEKAFMDSDHTFFLST
jgi:hypothetical protein